MATRHRAVVSFVIINQQFRGRTESLGLYFDSHGRIWTKKLKKKHPSNVWGPYFWQYMMLFGRSQLAEGLNALSPRQK